MFGSAIALGLGYGLLSPPASQLLARFTPPARRNLVFSLKQTGVPLGGILAASITPAVAVSFGWQWALAGAAAGACMLVLLMQRSRLLALGPGWPIAAAGALFFVLGATASGWNGTFMAEVARLSPRKDISTATAGSLVFVNFGKMVGPIAFTSIYLLTGSYTLLFGMLALPAAIGLACVLAANHLGARAGLAAARS